MNDIDRAARRIPPSLPGIPLLGNALDYRRDPLGLMSRAAREHGAVVRLRLGPRSLYLVSRPEDVERVLMESPARFGKSSIIRVSGRLLFGDALDALDGARWAERRRRLAPAFRPARIAASADVVVPHVRALVDRWRDGETRRFDRDALQLMLHACARSICGTDISPEDADEVGDAMRAALAAFDARVASGLPTPDWLPVAHNRRLRRAMTRVHRVVDAMIAAGGDGVLACLRGADAQEVRDEVAIMFALGGHQLSLALGWAVYLLASEEGVERRLHAEIDGTLAGRAPESADVDRLACTRAVVDETLRLYPPFAFFVRETLAPTEIGGFQLPRGATVVVSPWVTQRDPRWFEDPEAFRPERWTDGRAPRAPRFAYFPFGGGPRVCIAHQLARTQLVLALAAIAGRYRLRVAAGHRVAPRLVVGLGMRGGLPVTVHRRRPSPA